MAPRSLPKLGVQPSVTSQQADSVSKDSSNDNWSECSTGVNSHGTAYSSLDFESGLELVQSLSFEEKEIDRELCDLMLRLNQKELEETLQKVSIKHNKELR